MTTTHQEDLDDLSRSLSRLDLDSLLIVTTNALALHDSAPPLIVLQRISMVVTTAITVIDDDLVKVQCASMLRDAADIFEQAALRRQRVVN